MCTRKMIQDSVLAEQCNFTYLLIQSLREIKNAKSICFTIVPFKISSWIIVHLNLTWILANN